MVGSLAGVVKGGKKNGVLNFRMGSHTRDLIQFLSGAQVDEAVRWTRLFG